MPVCQLNIILSLRISHIKASWPGMAFTMPQISALSGKFPAMRRQLHFLPLRKAQLGHDISKPVPGSPITHIRVPLPTFVALLPYLPSPARTKKESRRNLFLQDPHSKKAASYSPASHRTLTQKRRPPTLPHRIAVPSAQAGLTSLFGMGRGGTPPQ